MAKDQAQQLAEKIKDAGGFAFPQTIQYAGGKTVFHHGLTIRDYFAAQVITGLIPSAVQENVDPDDISAAAYAVADAMLAARESGK